MNYDENATLAESSESHLSIEDVLVFLGDNEDLKRTVRTSEVIVVPTDLRPEYEGPAFPKSTRDIYRLLKHELAGDAVVEAAVQDHEYREFEYRSEQLLLPTLYVTTLTLLPLVINIVSSYVYDKLKERWGSSSQRYS